MVRHRQPPPPCACSSARCCGAQGFKTNEAGERVGFNTMVYSEPEVRDAPGCLAVAACTCTATGTQPLWLPAGQVERIAHVAFKLARKRQSRLTSVEKSNVLEVSMLWKEVVSRVGQAYPDVALSHMCGPALRALQPAAWRCLHPGRA